jgi:hypothetical protein
MDYKLFFLVVFLSFYSINSAAQKTKKGNEDEESEYDENYEFSETKQISVNLGIGLGLDYGGIGGKLTFRPTQYVGLFGALGYNLNGAGYNVGAIVRILPEAKVCPYFSLMYGYNAVIVIDGMSSADKTYYGTSIGAGIELQKKNNKFWTFGFVIPFRSQEYKDDLDALKNNPSVELTDPLPFQISVGYHFVL